MNINGTTLQSLYTGFNAAFQEGFGGVAPLYPRIAYTVPSTTRENEYGWLKQMPALREWIGDRVLNNIATDGYRIKNKRYEGTQTVDRDDIDDDNIGIYRPMFAEMGRAAAEHPDRLVWGALAAGFSTACFDGQYYFDTDHPVLNEAGQATSVSNFGGGAGTAWYLLDVSRILKPIIYQLRRDFSALTRLDKPDDPNVFMRNEYVYGVDGRCNVGYGFWQLAYASKQTLDEANYGAARAAMTGMKGDYGRPLGIRPQLLIVPPTLEAEARKLLVAETSAGGEANIWKGSAELLVCPWL